MFHSYGHKIDCQVSVHVYNIMYIFLNATMTGLYFLTIKLKYSPRNLEGYGLTDGEVVERLWAYLRRFARMTKEMRPSHRVDVLTDALLYYSNQSVKRLRQSHITMLIMINYEFLTSVARLLASRMKKTLKLQRESKHTLEEVMQNSPGAY